MNSNRFVEYLGYHPFITYSAMCERLSAQLYSTRGDYGTAFYLNDGRVGKIFKKHDYAYRTFLILIANSRSVHLPKVFDMGEHRFFDWVILEFLDVATSRKDQELTFAQITEGMTQLILNRETKVNLPRTLVELAHEMHIHGKGLCLDFHERNFGYRGDVIVPFDPFTIKTKTNSHLKAVAGTPLYRRAR